MAGAQEVLLVDAQLQQAELAAPVADEEAELAKLQAELYGAGGDEDGAGEDPGSDAAQQADGGDGDGDEGAAAVPMTKSQMKKKAKMERMLANRAQWRQREKAAKAQRRVEATERKAAELAGMTEEQKVELRRVKHAKLEAQKEQERQVKERIKQSVETGPRIVLDLDWESRMSENDIRHLVQQLSFSYAANKQVARPAHMMLTSFKGGLAATANKLISGMDKWHVTRTEEHYAQLFSSPEDKARLVYLTADAEDELDELDENKIYIIGGLVDHNRYKGLCEEQARAAGIATARLPISRHVQLASRAVLTVNHVFQILVEYYASRDWAGALDTVLPKRKRADYVKQPQQPQGQQAQGQQQKQGRQQQPGTRKDEQPSGDGGGAASKPAAEIGKEATASAEVKTEVAPAVAEAAPAVVKAEAAPAVAEAEAAPAVAEAEAAANAAGAETAAPATMAAEAAAGAGEAGEESLAVSLNGIKQEVEAGDDGRGTKRKAEAEPGTAD